MWKLKACNRCGGDIFISRDEYNDWYEQCLQCGKLSPLRRVVEVKSQPAIKMAHSEKGSIDEDMR